MSFETQPRKKLDLADTNMALVGSDLDKKMRAANAAGEAAWKGAGKKAGIEIWRIEKFCPVRYAYDADDTPLFDGDVFIFLVSKAGAASKPPAEWELYFWLGQCASQDEAGAAAIKVIELDDMLGGAPRQHRVVQGAETAEFLALFDQLPGQAFNVCEGGVASGFTKVTPPKPVPRLFHVRSEPGKGIFGTKMVSVPATVDSLCEDDCFCLDSAQKDIYVFQGSTCSPGERMKASQAAQEMAAKRSRGVKTHVFEFRNAPNEFWTLLGAAGGKPASIRAQPNPKDPMTARVVSLWRIKALPGAAEAKMLKVTEGPAGSGAIKMSMLESDDCFLIDAGAELFVWIGEDANKVERAQGMARAQEYLNQRPARSKSTPITTVREGFEGAYLLQMIDQDVPGLMKMKQIFQEADEDDNGTLSRQELLALCCQYFPNMSPSMVDKRMKELDTDNSGSLSMNEFKAMGKELAKAMKK